MNSYLINYKKNIRDCLIKLEKNSHKCLVVIDDLKQLKGTVTDGDIRRALLRRANLNAKIINYGEKIQYQLKLKIMLLMILRLKKNQRIT